MARNRRNKPKEAPVPVTPGEDAESYAPYDPTDVRPQLSADPPPSSDAPEVDGSLPGPDVEDLPMFNEKYVEDFNGLMYLGALTKTFEWVGHKFKIRTLTADEYLLVAILTKPYAGTIGEARAFSTAVVSLCVDLVDGQPLPVPIMTHSDENAWAYQRFNYVKARWFNPTIDLVYREFLVLEERANLVLAEMGKASGWEASATPGSDENSESPIAEDFSASPV